MEGHEHSSHRSVKLTLFSGVDVPCSLTCTLVARAMIHHDRQKVTAEEHMCTGIFEISLHLLVAMVTNVEHTYAHQETMCRERRFAFHVCSPITTYLALSASILLSAL